MVGVIELDDQNLRVKGSFPSQQKHYQHLRNDAGIVDLYMVVSSTLDSLGSLLVKLATNDYFAAPEHFPKVL